MHTFLLLGANVNTYFYSALHNSFFPLELKEDYINGIGWPEDAVEVTDHVYREFTGEPPEGQKRVAGKNGLPEWEDIPPPTHEEIVAQAEIERLSRTDAANGYMNGKQWPGKAAIGRLKGNDLTQYNLWLDYLDELEAVDTSSAPNIVWPISPAV